MLAACGAEIAPDPVPVSGVRWVDGDSGVFELEGEVVRFRLADVDAPETGSPGSAGGARCEAERRRGEAAKEFMQDAADRGDVEAVIAAPADRHGRLVVSLHVDGEALTGRGLAAGHLKGWPHRGGRALRAKPDWCG